LGSPGFSEVAHRGIPYANTCLDGKRFGHSAYRICIELAQGRNAAAYVKTFSAPYRHASIAAKLGAAEKIQQRSENAP
jgi:hypothetical protein